MQQLSLYSDMTHMDPIITIAEQKNSSDNNSNFNFVERERERKKMPKGRKKRRDQTCQVSLITSETPAFFMRSHS